MAKKTKPISSSPIAIELPPLLSWQDEVLKDSHPFKVLACGRRTGKTYFANMCALLTAYQGGAVGVFAPIVRQTDVSFKLCSEICNQINAHVLRTTGNECIKINEYKKQIKFLQGGTIDFLSTYEEDNLRGFEYDLAILDEAALMSKTCWNEIILPSLSKSASKALIISTPKGKGNWFYELYLAGTDEGNQYFKSWKLPTSANKTLNNTYHSTIKETMSKATYTQEILAEFTDDSIQVFHNFRNCIRDDIWQSEPKQGHVYIGGMDLAKQRDYSVVTIFDKTLNQICHIDRFNRLDWHLQIDRVEALYRKFHLMRMYVERNSIGDVILDEFKKRNLNVEGLYTTNQSKNLWIENLILHFEKQSISIPDYPPLIEELDYFQSALSKHGYTTYSAPDTGHDDCVMSLALCLNKTNSKMKSFSSFNRQFVGF